MTWNGFTPMADARSRNDNRRLQVNDLFAVLLDDLSALRVPLERLQGLQPLEQPLSAARPREPSRLVQKKDFFSPSTAAVRTFFGFSSINETASAFGFGGGSGALGASFGSSSFLAERAVIRGSSDFTGAPESLAAAPFPAFGFAPASAGFLVVDLLVFVVGIEAVRGSTAHGSTKPRPLSLSGPPVQRQKFSRLCLRRIQGSPQYR
jgi:hypothetical protein